MRDIKVKFKLKTWPRFVYKETESSSPKFTRKNIYVTREAKIRTKRGPWFPPDRKLSRLILLWLIGLIILGGIWGFMAGYRFKKIYRQAELLMSRFSQTADLLKGDSGFQSEEIKLELTDTSHRLIRIRDDLFNLKYVAIMPGIGLGIDTAERIIKGGYYTSLALNDLLEVSQSFYSFFQNNLASKMEGGDAESIKEILKLLIALKPTTNEAIKNLELAEGAINKIPFFLKQGKLKDILIKFNNYVPPLKGLLIDSNKVVDNLPEILGFTGKKNYLFFFLNNNEMTPPGGFPGSLGLLSVERGQFSDFQIQDVYKFQEENKANVLTPFHYSPDIPTTSQEIEKALSNSQFHQKIDGIIFVDTEILKLILKITGPLVIEDKDYKYRYLLTSSNVVDIIERHTKKTWWKVGEELYERKNILNHLLDAVLKKLPALREKDLINLGKGIKDLIEGKHLMFYFEDKTLQDLVKKYNAGGEIKRASNQDYCLIIDDNLAWSKSHQALKRKVIYRLDLQKRKAQLILNYFLDHEKNWKIWEIISYNKIYLPSNTVIEHYEGFSPEPPSTERFDELKSIANKYEKERSDKTIFKGWFEVDVKEDKSFKLLYQLPPQAIQKRSYKLLFQKQPGTTDTDLEIEINVGKRIKAIKPSGFIKKDGIIMWKTDLSRDREFEIDF